MALTEIYVDPSLASDTGDGSISTPYGDLEYAIEQTTFDTTNGTRVNIKAGTDEILAAKIDTAMADTGTTAAWVPSDSAPCVFQGYTSAAGDGGVGGISGGGLVSIINTSTLDYIFFVDLHLHNTGSALLAQVDDYCGFIRCEINNTTERGIFTGLNSIVSGCYLYDISGISAIVVGNGGFIEQCYFDLAGDGGMASGVIDTSAASALIYRNIISIDGAQRGLFIGDGAQAMHNSIYSNGGSGIGIQVEGGRDASIICNNLIEGFSSGSGIYTSAANTSCQIIRGNSFYNCGTDINDTSTSHPPIIAAGNESLSASPFTAAGSDFSPVDTGSVKEGAVPSTIGGGYV